ncbi:MAG: hypothetical protein HYU66_10745 [Armatimonadetes bacterium]|nr:hypothetical protein [Armatimonadota bacterium]
MVLLLAWSAHARRGQSRLGGHALPDRRPRAGPGYEQDRQADLVGEIEFTNSVRGTITKGRAQGLGRADEHRAILVPDNHRPIPPRAQ